MAALLVFDSCQMQPSMQYKHDKEHSHAIWNLVTLINSSTAENCPMVWKEKLGGACLNLQV